MADMAVGMKVPKRPHPSLCTPFQSQFPSFFFAQKRGWLVGWLFPFRPYREFHDLL